MSMISTTNMNAFVFASAGASIGATTLGPNNTGIDDDGLFDIPCTVRASRNDNADESLHCTRRVRFIDEVAGGQSPRSLVTSTRVLPKITDEEKHLLHYTDRDYRVFALEKRIDSKLKAIRQRSLVR